VGAVVEGRELSSKRMRMARRAVMRRGRYELGELDSLGVLEAILIQQFRTRVFSSILIRVIMKDKSIG
jgi:hypothetical protein